MPTFEITSPEGKKYRITGDNAQGAMDALRKATGQAASNQNPTMQPAPPAPVPVGEPANQEQGFERSTILPLGKDKATGEVSFAVPGLVKDIYEAGKSAVTLPGRVMSGEKQVMGPDGNVSPEMIGEAANFALFSSPVSPAQGQIKFAAPQSAGMETARAGQRIGVDLPRAVTSDIGSVQQAGKVLANVPVGGAPLRQASERAIGQLDEAAARTQQGFGTGDVASAGAAARAGIKDYSKSVLGGKVKDAYDTVDNLVTQNVTTPLRSTLKAATDITGRRANAQMAGESKAVSLIRKAIDQPEGLNYQGIKDLRTSIGEMLDNPSLIPADISQAELKRIYGGLTDDLRNAVRRSGGDEALGAFEKANGLAAKVAKEREGLAKVLGNDISDERLFDRIQAMASSSARADQSGLARVRGAVSKETWDEIAAGTLTKIGRDADGNFSPDRFVTGYGKMSPAGKAMLFGGKPELRSALDDIATVSRRFKQLNQYANPSGTGQTVLGGAIGSGFIADPVTALSSVASARVMSSILAKPTSARALAAYSRAYERQVTAPSKIGAQALMNSAKAMGALIGQEAGNPGLGQLVVPQISRVRQLPAGQGDQNNGAPEGQQGGQQSQPYQMMPNEI